MGGCYGNSPIDRYMENWLFRHLEDECCAYCNVCNIEGDIDDETKFRYDEKTDKTYCQKCGKEL